MFVWLFFFFLQYSKHLLEAAAKLVAVDETPGAVAEHLNAVLVNCRGQHPKLSLQVHERNKIDSSVQYK